VCLASTATTMLSSCVTGTNHNGGKLLLGNVSLYADGPTAGATGHYDDGHGSGDGTPAFIIPSKFWGIEGVSRGAGDAGATLGTFLSVCTGNGTPVSGCLHSFPQREYTSNNITVSGTNPTTMSVTIPAVVNVNAGELAMLKNAPSGDNGTFAIQSVAVGSSTLIKMVVPSGRRLALGVAGM